MSCPEWTHLVKRRDQEGEGEALWEQALAHLDGCTSCRRAAYAAEPTLVFRRLPALETTAADVETMKKSVRALRRAQPIVEPAAAAGRRRSRRIPHFSAVGLRAAAMVAVVFGAVFVFAILGGGGETVGTKSGLVETLFSAKAGPQDLRFEIRVLRASKHELSGAPLGQGDLPPKLAAELNEVIRYEHYNLLAEAGVDSAEGELTSSELGEDFEVSFKTGALEEGRRLLVEDFRIGRKGAVKGRRASGPVLQAPLELEIGEPFTLVVGSLNQEDLLVVAVTFHAGESGR